MTDAVVELANEAWVALHAARHGAPLPDPVRGAYWSDLVRAAETGASTSRVDRDPRDPSRRSQVNISREGEHLLIVASEDAVERAELVAAQSLAQVGSWTWDPRTDVAAWSESMHAIYGLPHDARSPSFAEQTRFYDSDTIRRTGVLLERAIQTGEPYELEYDLTRADGSVRHVLARGQAMRDADGQFAGLRGTIVDITALHAAREALRQSEQRFASVMAALRESVAIVRPMRDDTGEVFDLEIEWVNDAWKHLFGFTSRDPVGLRFLGVRPELQWVLPLHRRVLATGLPERATVPLDAKYLLEVDFTRLDDPRGHRLIAVSRPVKTELLDDEAVTADCVDVTALVDHLIPAIQTAYGRSVSVCSIARPGTAWALGDATRIREIVLQLAWNARATLAEGGELRIEVGTQGERAELRTVVVWVGDTALHLPAAARVESLDGPPARTVLLVDDEAPLRRIMRRAIASRGHRVLEADSAEAAREILAREHVDLMVTDVVMPGDSGLALVDELGGRIPVLVISGFAEPGIVADRGLPFLAKPFDRTQLVTTVDRALAPVAPTV